MKKLITTIKWDALLIYKYGIIAIATAITAIYSITFLFINTKGLEKLISTLIFSDPVMYGFLFTAVMILFEKESRTHMALAVSPLKHHEYILSKTITLTLLALFCSSVIMFAAQPQNFNGFLFFVAVTLSSTLFIFISIVGVSYVNNFNQFILLMPIVLGPTCLPFLSYFNLVDSWVFYLIPTQACLMLFEASIAPSSAIAILYAISYLLIWNVVCYIMAIRLYRRKILNINTRPIAN